MHDGELGEGDGYWVRTRENKKLGPMSEGLFEALRDSKDVDQVASAWRVAGGVFYKVHLQRTIKWDSRHACSFKACNHAMEMVIIVVCFGCTLGVFAMLRTSPEFQKERQQSGEGMWMLLLFLLGMTVITGILTMWKLWSRWRQASSDVFVSEV